MCIADGPSPMSHLSSNLDEQKTTENVIVVHYFRRIQHVRKITAPTVSFILRLWVVMRCSSEGVYGWLQWFFLATGNHVNHHIGSYTP